MNRLENKVAIITGGGSGLGKSTAELFVREGACVAIADYDEKAGKAVVEELKAAGGKAIFVKTDVTKDSDVKNMVEATVAEFGKLDILFNNVGFSGDLRPDIAHLDTPTIDRCYDINVKGTMRGFRYAVPYMVKNGGGSIISTASTAGMAGCIGGSAYGASKAAIINLTQTAAYELARHHIRCNSVSPFTMLTPLAIATHFQGEHGKEMMKFFGQDNMWRELIKPEQVANAVLFLASDESSGMTGQNLAVDYGFSVMGFSYVEKDFIADNQY